MSEQISPTTHLKYGVELVCKAWGYPRSTYYNRVRCHGSKKARGRHPEVSNETLTEAIKKCIKESPFQGEGHRKVHARLKRFQGMAIGRNRVLSIMREHKLLSPHRSVQGCVNPHDGRITTDVPNVMWGTDAAKVFTLEDGWVWFFGVLEHWNAECLGWHITKKGNRFAAIEALTRAVERTYGSTVPSIARGLRLRVDHGSQFLSEGFMQQSRYWGIGISKGFVREPETNGVIERFHRTFKEQIVHGRCYHNIHDFYAAAASFIEAYNNKWILEKLNYCSPVEARRLYLEGKNVLKPTKKRTNSTSLAERKGSTATVFWQPPKTLEKFTVSLREKGARLLYSGETKLP